MDSSRITYNAVPMDSHDIAASYDDYNMSPEPLKMEHTYEATAMDPKNESTAYDPHVVVSEILPSREEAKIALDTSFKVQRYIIHVLSLGVTAAVLQLSFRNVYVSDEDNWEDQKWTLGMDQEEVANFLQFPAKLHELLIMASVSTILFSIIRARLVGRRGVPLGYLTGGYQIGSVTYIFSGEFWGPLKGALASRRLGLVGFGLVLAFTMLYSMVVGPASAMLIVPRVSWWPIAVPFNGIDLTAFQGNSSDQIWPLEMSATLASMYPEAQYCAEDSFTALCPAGGAAQINEWTYANANQGAEPNITMSHRFGRSSRDVVSVTAVDHPTIQIGTSLHATIAELAGVYYHYIDGHDVGEASKPRRPRFKLTKESSAFSPLVRSECATYDWKQALDNPSSVTFPTSLQNDPNQLIAAPQDHWNYPEDGADGIGSAFVDISSLIDQGHRNESLLQTGASLGVTLLTPYYVQGADNIISQEHHLTVCLVDARWAATEVTFDPGVTQRVDHNLTELEKNKDIPQLQLNNDANKAKYHLSDSITISEAWAALLAPSGMQAPDKSGRPWNVDGLQSYLLAYNNRYRGTMWVTDEETGEESLRDNEYYGSWEPAELGDNFDQYVSNVTQTLTTIVNVAVTDGLARSTYPFYSFGVITYADDEIVEYEDLLRQEGQAETAKYKKALSDMSFDRYTFFTFDVDRYGYGYGVKDSKTVQFAVAVVLFHGLVVIIYLFLDLYWYWRRNRWTSTAWEGLGDLTALAWRSRAPAALENTGAGISNTDTWNMRVRIREKGPSQVELVIKEDDVRNLVKRGSHTSALDLGTVEAWGIAHQNEGVLRRGWAYT